MIDLALKTATLQPPAYRRAPVVRPQAVLEPARALQTNLGKLFEKFWGVSMTPVLFSISAEPHYYWHMQDFYVAQKGLDDVGLRWAQLRFSEGLCESLFETVLGRDTQEPAFSLNRLRNFEVFLLDRFSRQILGEIIPALLKTPGKKAPPPQYDTMMHLVWIVGSRADTPQMMVLTVPQACLKTKFEPDLLPSTEKTHLDERFLAQAQASVCLRVGRTAARLDELKQLEPGDWVLLEHSRLDQWALRHPVTRHWIPFPIALPDTLPDERRIKEFDPNQNDQGTQAMPQTDPTPSNSPTNLWDNLPVEVTAAFNPVKLPMKQLREIEQGLVLEVGELMENHITLEVEGQAVAWGELLVLGDKFGVRIQGLHQPASAMPIPQKNEPVNQSPNLTGANPSADAHNQEQPAAVTVPSNDIDSFNESDFDDLDDEDWN